MSRKKLRLECLKLAVVHADKRGDAHKIVDVAEVYYAFVTGETTSKLAEAVESIIESARTLRRYDRGYSQAIVTDSDKPLRTTADG